MKNKPFNLKSGFVMLPKELYDTRCPLTDQERLLLRFLYFRIYGYGLTACPLSYSVIFSDCHGIVKNNVKLNRLIVELENKGLISVERADKKTNVFVIERSHYNNLVKLLETGKARREPGGEPKWFAEKCLAMDTAEKELEKMLTSAEPEGLF